MFLNSGQNNSLNNSQTLQGLRGFPHNPLFPEYELSGKSIKGLPSEISPSRRLLDKFNSFSFNNLRNSFGILPVKWFCCSFNLSNEVKFPSTSGKLEPNSLKLKSKLLSEFCFPIEFGNLPFRRLWDKFRNWIPHCPPPITLIPLKKLFSERSTNFSDPPQNFLLYVKYWSYGAC